MDIKIAQNRLSSGLHPTPIETDSRNQDRTRLIIGIDFGTTFSKAAFTLLSNDEVEEGIINEWPGAGMHTKQDIPTTLYYDSYQNVVGWGLEPADALGPLGYHKPGVQKVDWFKLHFTAPETAHPLPPGKSEIDVTTDYLLKMREAVHAQLQMTLCDAFDREQDNIHYYLVVPAIWNDAAKAAIRVAATQAGLLHTGNNKNQLTLITGPRAAAMFYVKTGFFDLETRNTILIIDCGGGFVDLTAYEVKENPFKLTECAPSSGDSCGSTELNRNFAKILRAKIKKIGLRPGRIFAKCTIDFENRIKVEFRNNGQKWHIDVGVEADFPEADIQDGYMTFTNEDILQCFTPVVNRISELVRNQISAIQTEGRQLQVLHTSI
jgi:molecular chaperone DnaK (HSP70)